MGKAVVCVMRGALALSVAVVLECFGAPDAAANTVQLAPHAYAVAENGTGSVVLVVKATRRDPNAVITVDYASANGSAASGSDYSSVSGSLTFQAGDEEEQIVVPIINDGIAEGIEDFTVTLSNPGNATLAATNSNAGPSASITIADDESTTATIQFSSSAYRVNEASASTIISVVRSGALQSASSVQYETASGSAQPGQDYTTQADTLTFAAGETMRTIEIPIITDDFVEPAESFTISLANPSTNAALGPRQNAVVTIDDVASTVRFEPAAYTHVEGSSPEVTVKVVLERSSDSEGNVTVDYMTKDGSANAGLDYDSRSGTLVFEPGQTEKFVSIPIVNDQMAESAENFVVELSKPTNAKFVAGSVTATITIEDNDAAVFRFESGSYFVGEPQGSVTLRVTRSNNFSLTVVLNYQTSDGSAKAGSDYTASSGTLVFAPDETEKTIQVAIVNDTSAEAAETFVVNLSTSDPNATLGAPSTANVTISDEDASSVPVISSPSSARGTQGQDFRYQIEATNNPTSYDASGLPPGLFVNRANGLISGVPSQAGTFDVALTAANENGSGPPATLVLTIDPAPGTSPTPTPSATPSASPSPTASPAAAPSDLANLSTRAVVGSGNNVLIGGFIVQGDESKRVILRAIGPSLAGVGVSGSLADPTLELFDGSGASFGFNDDWKTGGQRDEIEQSGVPPGNEQESAIVVHLPPGNYTAVVAGANGGTGVGLVELYDLGGSSSRLVNISTRSRVSSGDDVMIAGFIIGSENATRVMLRAIGPSLSQANPPVPNALPDPSLELRDGEGSLITSNDNWVNSPQREQIEQSGIAPSDGRESAIIAELPKGTYTAIVRSSDGSAGVALVEVYRLDP